jgi:hypothetical protein
MLLFLNFVFHFDLVFNCFVSFANIKVFCFLYIHFGSYVVGIELLHCVSLQHCVFFT